MRTSSFAFAGLTTLVFAHAFSGCACGPETPDYTGGAGGTAGGTSTGYPECEAPGSEKKLLADAQAAIESADVVRRTAWKSLFGLQADDTIATDGLDGIDWDPSHDSVYFTSLDVDRNIPILVSNDTGGGSPSKHVALGIAGETSTHRYALLGANPLADLALAPPPSGTDAAKMKDFLRGLIHWLTSRDPGDGSGMKIVLAHLADTYWFNHDKGTAKYLASEFPKATINAEDKCDGTALAGCLDGASLLVMSDQDNNDDENNLGTTDADAVMAALDGAAKQGIPVLYVQYDGSLTRLGARMMARFGVTTTDNYWDREKLTAFSATQLPAADDLTALRSLVTTLSTNALTTADVAPCVGQVSQLADCDAAGYVDKLGRGADALQATMSGLDEAGVNPFATDGFHLARTLARLGEVYRGGMTYPVDVAGDPAAFARAVVGDASVHYAQHCGAAQPDLGTFVCPRSDVLAHTCPAYDPAKLPRTTEQQKVTEPFRASTEWTSTGLYAIPGQQFSVFRTDHVGARASVRINFQRRGTSRPFATDGKLSRYDRPAYLASPWIPIDGETRLVSPYGGPIYVRLEGTPEVAGQTAEIFFEQVGKHAALLNVGATGAIGPFVTSVAASPFPHVDLRGNGFEVHLRKDHFLNGVTAPYGLVSRGDGTQVMVDYKGDLGLLLADFRDNFVAPEYRLAGFAPPSSTLDKALSDDVKAICQNLSWACTDPAIHARSQIQHANYDEYANCGDGCSGNPFDADWNIMPLGWGESHELGHNLQMSVLQVGYALEANRNDWSQYQGRATESSNNIFPYHNTWRWLRQVKNETGTVVDDHMNLKTLFAMVQSSKAGLTRTINGQMRKVVFDEACKVVGDYPPSAANVHAEAIWEDGGYAATNGPRMGFYLQLPLRLHGQTMSDGTKLRDGFDIFTLLYAQARTFLHAAGDDMTWAASRKALGFDLFARSGDPTYGGASVDGITGNDFLLVALSFLSGLDFRPYFADMGVRVSDLAAAQVDAHVASGRVTGVVPGVLSVLETDFPGADLGTVETVAADGVAVWPRDGWHPASCP